MRLSVIILTYNEEHNLPDCLESLKGLESELFVVDSGSTDRTREIAEQYGAKVFQHSFENYAAQRNWTQQNLPIRGEWLLHLDADERLTPELVTEIQETLNETSREHGARSREQSEAGAARLRTSNEQGAGSREPEEARGQRLEVGGERTANGEWQIAESREHGAGSQRGRRTDIGSRKSEAGSDGIHGYLLRKRTLFMGRWIRHGGHYPSYHLRLFRKDRGFCEDRLYDQHFLVNGKVKALKHDYVDMLTPDINTWIQRHTRWAELEAQQLLAGSNGNAQVRPAFFGNPIERRRWLRDGLYGRSPLFIRAFLYWVYRYFLRLGFLDGKEGLIFHFLQGFWFRFLIDAKIFERQRQNRIFNHKDTKARLN